MPNKKILKPSKTPIVRKPIAIQKAKELYDYVKNMEVMLRSKIILTDLSKFIEKLDIDVLFIDINNLENLPIKDDDVSGILVKDNGEYTIYVNENDSAISQRWTIAHEIGHYMLGHLCNKEAQSIRISYKADNREEYAKRRSIARNQNSGANTTDPLESVANDFAAELLMPETLTKYAYAVHGNIRKVAAIFAVSEKTAEIRLKELDII